MANEPPSRAGRGAGSVRTASSGSRLRYLPGWARFILALWAICLMLLGIQQLALFVFTAAGGG